MTRRRLKRPVVRPLPVGEDVERELRHHVAERAAELEAAGWAPEAARAEAERLLGNRATVAEEMRIIERASRRARRRAGMLDSVHQDLKFAFRTLRRSPGYTAVALVTLLLGIGANTAVFSVVNGVLLRPLPYPQPDRLVRVMEVSPNGQRMGSAWRNFVDWREGSSSFAGLVAHDAGGGGGISVVTDGVALQANSSVVSRGFLQVLGVEPVWGRDFATDEHQVGATPVVLVSHAFWETRLGGRPLDDTWITADGLDVQVVGVLPAGFDYPGGTDIWVPMEIFNSGTESRTAHNWRVTGRLAPGVTLAQADAELDAITAGFLAAQPEVVNSDAYGDFWPAEAEIQSLHEATVGDTRRPLLILLGAAALVLLVACTNLASTTLARGTARMRELAVRRSLGAGRARVVRQLFTESVLLALLGAALGAGLAVWLVRVLPLVAPAGIPRLDQVRVDGSVLVFTVLMALVTAILSGLLPALRDTRAPLSGTLRSGGRAGEGRRERRIWRGLVSAEVALALMLLVGSGLLLRSFWSILAVDPGYATENVLTTRLAPPSGRYPTGQERARYFQQVLETLAAVPGVGAVGLGSGGPLESTSNGRLDLRNAGSPGISAHYQLVSPGFFSAMDIPLVRGRMFGGTERPDGEHVVLVSRSFAEAAWPGEDPIGKQITGGGMDEYWEAEGGKWATVIGVVGDVRQRELTGAPNLVAYFPLGQRVQRTWGLTVVLTPAAGTASALAPAVRSALNRVDGDVPVAFSTVEELLGGVMAERRFTMSILLLFAGVALLLACVGIYGVVSYAVERRTREIGIRIALGADVTGVRALVRRDFMAATGGGILLGSALALWLTRLLEASLFGVSATDPATFLAVAGVLAAAAWVASFVPSLRVSRISPMETMRAE